MSISETSPLIIAHRGASAVAPENTLASFARALDEGADGIELDVRLAHDGVPVVIHDASLGRTGRRNAQVANLTSARLSQIDVGSWFNHTHPRFARLQYTRQTVPTLDDVLRLLLNQSNNDFIVYVEIKAGRKRNVHASLARAVVDVISQYKLHHRCIVIGFNLTAVARVKEFDTSIRTGALFGPRQRAAKSARRIIEATLDCGADEILLHHLVATPRLIARALEAKLVPVVWTVDDPKWIGRAMQHRLHALVTNNPAKMSTVI